MIKSNIEQTNIIIDKTAKPNNEETITEEQTNTTKNQLQCEICTFKCRYKKSLNTHIKKNHTNVVNEHNKTNDTDTDNNTDSTEVTPAENDDTSASENNDSDSNSDNDYDEVTSAEEDNTPSTPDHTTNTSPNHIIQHFQAIMDWIDKYCIHYQKGTCKFGDRCNKKHTCIPMITCPICEHTGMNLGQFKFHITTNHDPTKKFQEPS